MDFAADISAFYSDFGTPALRTPAAGSIETTPHLVILDRGGQRFLGGDVVMSSPSIQAPRNTWPTLAKNDTLTMAGEVWRLLEAPQPSEDGTEITAPVMLVRP